MLALIQSRACPVLFLLLVVQFTVAAEEEVPLCHFGRCVSLHGDFTQKEKCCIIQKLISALE